MGDFANRQIRGGSEQQQLSHLTFYDQHTCDFGCRHCSAGPVDPPNAKGNQTLSGNAILTAVHEALSLGLRIIQFSGGDIFEHAEIDQLLDETEKLELAITLETNGSGLTPRLADRLAHLPQCRVVLGLDGANADTHNHLNDSHSLYEQIIQAARLLKAAGQATQITFTIQRSNVGQISDMIRLAEKLGAASLRVVSPRPVYPARVNGNGHNGHQPKLKLVDALSVEELIALGWRIERKLASNTSVHLTFDQPPVFRGLHPSAHIEGQGRCNILTSLAVLSTGEYVLCGLAERVPELIFGKVGSDALDKIWLSHPVLKTLRDGLPDQLKGICDRCTMKTSCLGNCPAENYLRSGSFFGAYWFCEAAEQAGLFPAGRLIENCW